MGLSPASPVNGSEAASDEDAYQPGGSLAGNDSIEASSTSFEVSGTLGSGAGFS